MLTLLIRLAAITNLLIIAFQPALACTDFVVNAQDGAVVNGRSMEWGEDLHSRLVLHPVHEAVASDAPGGKKGVSWTSKYGYIGIDANGLNCSVDGLNEKGLSVGFLWLPTYTKYQDVPAGQEASALDITTAGAWLLGNFSTVEEVHEAISKVRVWAPDIPSFGGTPTAHFAIHDASGKNLVIEFVGGEQKIYDNPLGVLTNAPPFDWQTINLRNYLQLRAANPAPVKFDGKVYNSAGQGGGLLGIPGDWQPPSRFVRTSAILHFSQPVPTAKSAVNLSEHVLNAVDIPIGAISDTINGVVHHDYTQWIVVKDLSNKVLYYRSYDNLTLRYIDLKKLDFTKGTSAKLVSIESGQPAEDATSAMQ
jgi:choloylglycine hydrolase